MGITIKIAIKLLVQVRGERDTFIDIDVQDGAFLFSSNIYEVF